MESLGKIFKHIRETNDITLAEIEDATKIRIKYLKAIEEDKFDEIPGKVYAKGFVKSYARYLKIDQEPVILEMIEEAFGNTAPAVSAPAEDAAPQKEEKHLEKKAKREQPIEDKPLNKKISRIIGISVLFVVLLLAIGGIYSLKNGEDENDEPNTVIQQQENNSDDANKQTTPDNENPPATPNSQDKPKYDGLSMTISINDVRPNTVDKCWLQVTADGKLLWEETLNEGASKTVTAAESIRIKAGNAGVVKITLNDQDLGIMGSYSQVVTKEYTLDSLTGNQTTVYSPGAKEPVSGGIYDEKPTEVTNEDPNKVNPTE